MDSKDLMKVRADQSLHCLLDKIDEICDDARDDGGLSSDDVRTLEKAWKAICVIHDLTKA